MNRTQSDVSRCKKKHLPLFLAELAAVGRLEFEALHEACEEGEHLVLGERAADTFPKNDRKHHTRR